LRDTEGNDGTRVNAARVKAASRIFEKKIK